MFSTLRATIWNAARHLDELAQIVDEWCVAAVSELPIKERAVESERRNERGGAVAAER